MVSEHLGLYAAKRYMNRRIEEAIGPKLHFDAGFVEVEIEAA